MELSSRTCKLYVLRASPTTETDSQPSETEHVICYCDCDSIVLQDGAQPESPQSSNAPRNVHDDTRDHNHYKYKYISALTYPRPGGAQHRARCAEQK